MSLTLPLKEMTLREKLAAMESLWEDIARSPEAIESPSWHMEILDGRREQIAEGKAQFTDWEKAKTEIRKKLL
jgi:putative addiction module component